MPWTRRIVVVALALCLLPLAAGAQADDDVAQLAKSLLLQAQAGHFDRTQFSGKLDAKMDDDTVADLSKQLKPLGTPSAFDLESKTGIDTSTVYEFHVTFKSGVIEETLTLGSDGKLSDLSFNPPQS
jgi:hypothetical protein